MNEGSGEVGVAGTTSLDADGDLEAHAVFERDSTDDVVAPGLQPEAQCRWAGAPRRGHWADVDSKLESVWMAHRIVLCATAS
jgi:hypothetical protein